MLLSLLLGAYAPVVAGWVRGGHQGRSRTTPADFVTPSAVLDTFSTPQEYAYPQSDSYTTPPRPVRHGGGLDVLFEWAQVDFNYPSAEAKQIALNSGQFVPANVLPLGVAPFKDRLFITLPKWKKGIPASLATVQLDSRGRKDPILTPYPAWSWHTGNCHGVVSAFRLAVDKCQRLWVLDSGAVDIATGAKQLCPAKILVFDLKTDRVVLRHILPKSQVLPGSLLVNIAVEDGPTCSDTHAYISDVFRYTLHVFSTRLEKSWRVGHPFFHPDPFSSFYTLDGFKFQWTDGVFGLAISPDNGSGIRNLYFHPLSSQREFSVPTYILHNETLSTRSADMFRPVGDVRRKARGQATASAMTRHGVLLYNLVARSAVGCWHSARPHTPRHHATIAQSNTTLSFPNDLRLDDEEHQRVYVLSNKLHIYLYDNLNPREINFRVLSGRVDDLIRGTVCDPDTPPPANQPTRRCAKARQSNPMDSKH